MRLAFERSATDFGWWATLYILGKHRARWNSHRATTRMWPRLIRGSDEDCNRSLSIVVWPLGHLDVWWEPHWRAAGAGLCDQCRAEEAAA